MSPFFFASILITLLFFISGFEKIYLFAQSTGKFAKKMGISLTLAQFIICCVIILELVAPTLIAAFLYTGLRSLAPFYKLSVIALALFTILATMIYHNPFKGKEKYYAFMSNLSTLGGLMALYIVV